MNRPPNREEKENFWQDYTDCFKLTIRNFSKGNFLVVHHGDFKGEDLQSVYLHLNSIAVAVDQAVQEGELIGYVGKTGCNINRVHLHFETYTGVTSTGSGNIQRLKTRNPFRFLSYTSVDPTADATRDSQYIHLNLSQPRDGADIVRVVIENDVTGDLVLDFESREGMNSADDDETPYQGIEISPVDFKNSSDLYEMTLHYDATMLNGGSAFFAYYFPKFKIGNIEYLDKEFINKYNFLKDNIISDLFLLIEIEIEGKTQEVLIVIEHKSERREVRERLYEYSFYARMLRKKPVWSMVLYTDEGIWKKSVPKQLCYGFHSELGKQWFHIDAIKLKEEKSEDLIRQDSLVIKLLALKSDDRNVNREDLVREVLVAARKMEKQLTEDQNLLAQRFVETYHNLPENIYQEITDFGGRGQNDICCNYHHGTL